MASTDYLEWQISYDTENINDPSIVREARLEKRNGTRYGCELVRLLFEARNLALLSDDRWQDLRSLLDSQISIDGIEERERIVVALLPLMDNDPIESRFGFRRHVHYVPDYLKVAPCYSVEVKIGPKQRAVGTQAMIYVHLPLHSCVGSNARSFDGRIAEKGEKANYLIDRENASLVFDTTVAFVLASRSHAHDMRLIFEALNRCSVIN